ncbi:AsmA-like C-terminal domain-containing protein [uncultured Arcobacter sp.]|uniref:YhdP family protein n=1 Tax=uncultured Arcobacter sp. TaxID=165434 RepID=UPI00261E6BB2|nr:AsmA-like C-terminal domain-containing protein [uncultured Arcobacter sp.]
MDSFSLGDFSVSKFYLKIDKKLILQIDEIVIKDKKTKVNNSFEDIKSLLNKAPMVLSFFQNIDIETMEIADNKFKIQLEDDYIYIDNKYVNIASEYSEEGDSLKLDIYSIYLKDINLLLLGNMNIDLHKNILVFLGRYFYKNLASGELNIQSNKEELDFFINSGELENIKFLKNYISLDKIAESWMYDNIQGKLYLDYLYGKVDLNSLTPILNSISGYARVLDATVKFNKDLDVVNTPLINLEYKNDNLLIKLKEPIYKGISIDGSFVDIKDMTSLKYGHVDVTLKANHLLDDNVLEILKAYKINLPLKQISGKTQADVHLYIPYDSPMKTFGVFKAKDSTFKINDFEFYSKDGDVELINTDVIIKNTDFVHKDMINAKVNLKIDTKTLDSKGNALLNKFLIKSDNQEIVKIEDKKIDFTIDFKDNAKLNIDELETQILFQKDSTDINIANLEKLYPYSKLLSDINIKKGDLSIKLLDDNEISFMANLFELDLPLKKDDKDVDTLKLFGLINKDKTSINTASNDLVIDIIKDKIKIIINSYDIDMTKSENKNSLIQDLSVRLIDSNILLKDNSFYSIDSNIDIVKDDIFFDGTFGKLDIPIKEGDKKLDKLDIKGYLKKDLVKVVSKDKKLDLSLKNSDEIYLELNELDLIYNTNNDDVNKYKKIKIKGKNSNLIINDKYKVLSDDYIISSNDKNTIFDLVYLDGKIKYIKDSHKNINLRATDINELFVNTFFDKEIIKGGTFSLEASGKGDLISGKMLFNKNRLLNLTILNNLITLVNTSPALINPLLAIPAVFGMVTNGGFNLNGYAVNEGYIDFTYDFENRILNLIKIHMIGNSVDFEGYATLNLKESYVNANVDLIFMKDYTKIVNFIPGLNYLFLGDEKRVSTKVKITGDLNNPKIETQLAKDSISAPVNFFKRVITSPLKLFEK